MEWFPEEFLSTLNRKDELARWGRAENVPTCGKTIALKIHYCWSGECVGRCVRKETGEIGMRSCKTSKICGGVWTLPRRQWRAAKCHKKWNVSSDLHLEICLCLLLEECISGPIWLERETKSVGSPREEGKEDFGLCSCREARTNKEHQAIF